MCREDSALGWHPFGGLNHAIAERGYFGKTFCQFIGKWSSVSYRDISSVS